MRPPPIIHPLYTILSVLQCPLLVQGVDLGWTGQGRQPGEGGCDKGLVLARVAADHPEGPQRKVPPSGLQREQKVPCIQRGRQKIVNLPSSLSLAWLVLNILINRVTLVVEYLGWVDLDLGCSTILLGQ